MFSKVWDFVSIVGWWMAFGLSMYLLFTEGLTDEWWDAVVLLVALDFGQRIRALEKSQESQAS